MEDTRDPRGQENPISVAFGASNNSRHAQEGSCLHLTSSLLYYVLDDCALIPSVPEIKAGGDDGGLTVLRYSLKR